MSEPSKKQFDTFKMDCYDAGFQEFNVPVRYSNPVYLGGGSQGVVISVNDSISDKEVAIKKLIYPFRSVSYAKNTYREFSLLSNIKHPNLCRRKRFDHRYISFFIYQCLCAVNYIHRYGCIHRDLKPGNIVVDDECKLKILDFGLARKTSKEKMTNQVVTPYYKAPEVLFRIKYDEKIDVWSIGCILAEMALRSRLFEGEGSHDVNQCRRIVQIRGAPTQTMLDSMKRRGGMQDMLKVLKQMGPIREMPMETIFPDKLIPNEEGECTNVNFRDLIKNMLAIDPSERYSITDALKHKYVRGWYKEEEVLTAQSPTPFDLEMDFRNIRQWKEKVIGDIMAYENAHDIFTDKFS